MNLNQVTVQSKDVRESIDFYAHLGLQLIVENEHYARFECPGGDSTFSVFLTERVKESNTIVYFEVDDLELTVAELKAKGLKFNQDPKHEPWLWFESHLKDPSGNDICLYVAGVNRKSPPWRIV